MFLGAENKRNIASNGGSRGLEITARKAAAAKNIEVEVDKPLGLTLGPKQGGGVVITVCNLLLSIMSIYFVLF